jgi:hypothetical protein
LERALDRVAVRDSSRAEEAVDELVKVCLDCPARQSSDEDTEDSLYDYISWGENVVKAAEEVRRLLALEAAGAPVVRR